MSESLHDAEIERRFTYHKPVGDQSLRYEALRRKAKELAYLFRDYCPDSRERSLALTYVQLAVMWANASIAVRESDPSLKAVLQESESKPAADQCCERDPNQDGNCDRHLNGARIDRGLEDLNAFIQDTWKVTPNTVQLSALALKMQQWLRL